MREDFINIVNVMFEHVKDLDWGTIKISMEDWDVSVTSMAHEEIVQKSYREAYKL